MTGMRTNQGAVADGHHADVWIAQESAQKWG